MEEKRLVLFCDIKCGFDDLFITEKNVAITVDFLSNKDYYKEILRQLKVANKFTVGKVSTREELFEKYKDKPMELLTNKGIYEAIKTNISETFAIGYFYGLDLKADTNKGYPELFEMSNLRLELIDKKQFDDLALEEFEFKEVEEPEDQVPDILEIPKKPIDTGDFKIEDNEKIWKA